ncbi:MAG: hypothetical protein GF329_16695 [Candidatus Lokiarchaeota archaeon]|nr:hypothetical protein [Candidatus Lokiarchaeota archaeon]
MNHINLLSKINRLFHTKLIRGVQLSTANVMGPTPQKTHPKLDENYRNIIAMKSLILLAGNKDERNFAASMIPIQKDICLVYLFFIEHPSGRAGIFDASVSFIVDSRIRNLLIKSMNQATREIERYLKESKPSVDKNGDIISLKKPIQSLYESLKEILLMNSDPIQVFEIGNTKSDIDEFKKSINDLRSMLSKFD